MKCEICHKANAETAITREADGEEEELYVCKACAAQERKSRQKKSQRTRKFIGPGISMSVTEISGDEDGEPPPLIAALFGAMNEVAKDLEEVAGKTEKKGAKTAPDEAKAASEPKWERFPTERVERPYRFGGGLHLEGLHLIGEVEAVQRAARALRMELVGVDADGVHAAGHIYELHYTGSAERARRVAADILRQERNARVRLRTEMTRVFGDALCRALAVLKNCRLLAPGELFDLLSPLRLAALDKALDGVTVRELESLAENLDLSGAEDKLEQDERDRLDAERADAMNRRFEDVVLNERAEGKYL